MKLDRKTQVWLLHNQYLPLFSKVFNFILSVICQSFILASIFCMLIALTLIGNSLIIIALITNKTLQQPCNFFLASLAVADLGVNFQIFNCFHSCWLKGWLVCYDTKSYLWTSGTLAPWIFPLSGNNGNYHKYIHVFI